MWSDLETPWQEAFALAWEAYRRGTIPIGAIIVDENQAIVARGRNRIFDTDSRNPLAGTYMAHAEMTAMMHLKAEKHRNIRAYCLYSTMEPCPMCFCTMLMMHVGNLKYAARDGFAGGTDLKDKTDYVNRKKMSIERGNREMEDFQIVLQSSFEFSTRKYDRFNDVILAWMKDCREGVLLGEILSKENYFPDAIVAGKAVGQVYDEVSIRMQSFTHPELRESSLQGGG